LKLEKSGIHECQLQRVLCQTALPSLVVDYFAEGRQEVVRRTEDQIELQCFQYFRLHTQQLCLAEHTRRQTYQLIRLGNLVCLFVFGSDQQCC
jgi:hypothetical protein